MLGYETMLTWKTEQECEEGKGAAGFEAGIELKTTWISLARIRKCIVAAPRTDTVCISGTCGGKGAAKARGCGKDPSNDGKGDHDAAKRSVGKALGHGCKVVV